MKAMKKRVRNENHETLRRELGHHVGVMIEDFDRKLDLVVEDLADVKKTVYQHTEILEKHTEVLSEHTDILNEHTDILDKHTEILNEHTQILNQHTETLQTHSNVLKMHSEMLGMHGDMLEEINGKIDGKADKKSQLEIERRLSGVEKRAPL